MSSNLVLKHPRQIFSGPRLPPPRWPQRTDSLPQRALVPPSSSLQWTSSRDNCELSSYLRYLQQDLRSIQKRKILWSMDEPVESNPLPNKYLEVVLKPLADVFNQLRCPRIEPMKYNAFELYETIYGAVFSSNYLYRPNSVMVLAMPNNLFEPEGNVSLTASCVLSRALEYDSRAPSAIIVTDFKDIAVFFPPSRTNPQPFFERVTSAQFSLTLQVISAACIHGAISPGHWFDIPDPGYEFVLPEGPAQNPDGFILSDDDVLATHHRHSDFDIPTLLRNKARALQYLRWHDDIQRRYSKLVAKPKDVLRAVPNALDSTSIRPLYPFDTPELPPDTVKHIIETQRPSPMQATRLMERFMHSKSFLVEVQDIISGGSERGICTVYRCKIISIDNRPVALSPNLCLKLFDDRFQVFHEHIQEGIRDAKEEDVYLWLDPLITTEALITNEILAYNKLQSVQGSVIPWFYGAHQFTLSDGRVFYGLLMEHIDGQEVQANIEPAFSQERQIQMIKSCRHAARILDVGDIGQQDWHTGQILLYTNPMTQSDHIVLVDFGLTTQTYEEENLNYIGNYEGILNVLLYQKSTLDHGLVRKHYGEPDDWDPVRYIRDDRILFKARDMFPFISIS